MNMQISSDALARERASSARLRQYLGRAIRLRSIAQELNDSEHRNALIELADRYDEMAIAAAQARVAGSA